MNFWKITFFLRGQKTPKNPFFWYFFYTLKFDDFWSKSDPQNPDFGVQIWPLGTRFWGPRPPPGTPQGSPGGGGPKNPEGNTRRICSFHGGGTVGPLKSGFRGRFQPWNGLGGSNPGFWPPLPRGVLGGKRPPLPGVEIRPRGSHIIYIAMCSSEKREKLIFRVKKHSVNLIRFC
jgi:hypothetical protein